MLLMSPRLARLIAAGLSVVVGGCGGMSARAPVVTHGSAGSCAVLSRTAQFSRATVVVIGMMRSGPVVRFAGRETLVSPARVAVSRYLKGSGPKAIQVRTAIEAAGGGAQVTEDGIAPTAGQRWKLFLTGRRSPYATSTCAGSEPMRAASL
jgi:hypothetical protein